MVTLLPAYKGNNSVGCAAYFGIENIVIPAVERLLDEEAGRTAVVAHSRIFLAFTVEVLSNLSRNRSICLCTDVPLCVFATSRMRRFTFHAVLLLFMMD